MAVLSRSTVDGGKPILQTSVWGRTHLNVGWFRRRRQHPGPRRCSRLRHPGHPAAVRGGGTCVLRHRSCAVMFGLMLPSSGRPGRAGGPGACSDRPPAARSSWVLDRLRARGRGDASGLGGPPLDQTTARSAASRPETRRVLSVGGFLNIKPPNLDLYRSAVHFCGVPESSRTRSSRTCASTQCTAERSSDHPVTYEAFRACADCRDRGLGHRAGPRDR